MIAIDLLGCGSSDRPNTPYTLQIYTELLEGFCKELSLKEIILVGSCVGASISLEYSKVYPQNIKALALFNVFTGTHSIPSLKLVEWGLLKPSWVARFLSSRFIPQASRLFGRTPPSADPLLNYINETLNAHPLRIQSRANFVAGAPSFSQFGSSETDLSCTMPCLLFWGAKNQIVSISKGEAFARSLKPREFVVLESSGHLAMYEESERVNKTLSEFFESMT